MKKNVCFLLSVFLFFGVFFCSFSQESDVAQDITKEVTMNLISGNGSPSRLVDRTVSTACSSKDLFELRITSQAPIFGIYLMWNHTPPQWSLDDGVSTVLGGQQGFWHEYRELSGNTTYTFSWEGEGHLAEIYFLSKGSELPDFVQVWDAPCEKADFLLLPTHADDEHLWFGGTMPYYGGELGYKIQVVYLMKHVSGRHHELLNGLWRVGIRNYPVISEFEDKYCANLSQAKKYYPEEEILEFLVENIRRFKPEVIVGHDLNGEYGHGAHILNATVLSSQALTVANDATRFPESFEKYGLWETKKCYLHLYEQNEIFIDWKAMPLSSFQGMSAYDVAQAGFNEHVSQRNYFSMSLDNRSRYGNGLFGLYFSTVGPDVLKNDFLENIPEKCLSNWVEPLPEITEPPTDTEHNSSDISDDTSMNLNTEKTFPKWIILLSVFWGFVSIIGIVILISVFRKQHLK